MASRDPQQGNGLLDLLTEDEKQGRPPQQTTVRGGLQGLSTEGVEGPAGLRKIWQEIKAAVGTREGLEELSVRALQGFHETAAKIGSQVKWGAANSPIAWLLRADPDIDKEDVRRWIDKAGEGVERVAGAAARATIIGGQVAAGQHAAAAETIAEEGPRMFARLPSVEDVEAATRRIEEAGEHVPTETQRMLAGDIAPIAVAGGITAQLGAAIPSFGRLITLSKGESLARIAGRLAVRGGVTGAAFGQVEEPGDVKRSLLDAALFATLDPAFGVGGRAIGRPIARAAGRAGIEVRGRLLSEVLARGKTPPEAEFARRVATGQSLRDRVTERMARGQMVPEDEARVFVAGPEGTRIVDRPRTMAENVDRIVELRQQISQPPAVPDVRFTTRENFVEEFNRLIDHAETYERDAAGMIAELRAREGVLAREMMTPDERKSILKLLEDTAIDVYQRGNKGYEEYAEVLELAHRLGFSNAEIALMTEVRAGAPTAARTSEKALITKNTRKAEQPYRVTFFDDRGMPSGHMDAASPADALAFAEKYGFKLDNPDAPNPLNQSLSIDKGSENWANARIEQAIDDVAGWDVYLRDLPPGEMPHWAAEIDRVNAIRADVQNPAPDSPFAKVPMAPEEFERRVAERTAHFERTTDIPNPDEIIDDLIGRTREADFIGEIPEEAIVTPPHEIKIEVGKVRELDVDSQAEFAFSFGEENVPKTAQTWGTTVRDKTGELVDVGGYYFPDIGEIEVSLIGDIADDFVKADVGLTQFRELFRELRKVFPEAKRIIADRGGSSVRPGPRIIDLEKHDRLVGIGEIPESAFIDLEAPPSRRPLRMTEAEERATSRSGLTEHEEQIVARSDEEMARALRQGDMGRGAAAARRKLDVQRRAERIAQERLEGVTIEYHGEVEPTAAGEAVHNYTVSTPTGTVDAVVTEKLGGRILDVAMTRESTGAMVADLEEPGLKAFIAHLAERFPEADAFGTVRPKPGSVNAAIESGTSTIDEFVVDGYLPDFRGWAGTGGPVNIINIPEVRAAAEQHIGSLARFGLDYGGENLLARTVVDITKALGPAKKMTWSEARKVAASLGINPSLLERKRATSLTRNEMLAIKMILNQDTRRLQEVYRDIAMTGEFGREAFTAEGQSHINALMTEAAAIEQRMVNLTGKFMKQRSETGRALNQLKMYVTSADLDMSDPAPWMTLAKRMLRDRPLTPDVRENIVKLLGQGDKDALALYIANLYEASPIEKVIALWKAGLLTAFQTHAANLIGNTTMLTLEILKDVPAYAVDRVLSEIGTMAGRQTKALSPAAQLTGTLKGARKGLKEAWQVLKKGDTAEAMRRWDVHEIDYGNAFLNWYVNGTFRLLTAGDRIFRNAALQRSLVERATVLARNEARIKIRAGDMEQAGSEKWIADRIKKILESPPDHVTFGAIADSEYAIFMDRSVLARAGQQLRRGFKGDPLTEIGAETIMPFVFTPANIAQRTIDYSPLRLGVEIPHAIKIMTRAARGANIPEQEQRAVAEYLGRAIIGSAPIGIGAWLGYKGLATADYPRDQNERDRWALYNIQEWSISLDDRKSWRSLGRISPVGNLIGIGAKFGQEYASDHPVEEQALQSVATIARSVVEQSFLLGISGAMELLKGEPGAGRRFVNTYMSSVVPSIVRRVAMGTDDYMRDIRGIDPGGAIKKSLPIVSRDLPAKMDPFGEPIERAGGLIANIFDPFTKKDSRIGSDPLITEMARVRAVIGMPNKRKHESDEAYYLRLQEDGPIVRAALEATISSIGYRQGIRRASAILQMERPDLFKDVDELEMILQSAVIEAVAGLVRQRISMARGGMDIPNLLRGLDITDIMRQEAAEEVIERQNALRTQGQ